MPSAHIVASTAVIGTGVQETTVNVDLATAVTGLRTMFYMVALLEGFIRTNITLQTSWMKVSPAFTDHFMTMLIIIFPASSN